MVLGYICVIPACEVQSRNLDCMVGCGSANFTRAVATRLSKERANELTNMKISYGKNIKDPRITPSAFMSHWSSFFFIWENLEKRDWWMELIPRRAGLRRVPAAGGTRCSGGRRLFKSSGCFLLIELDEVFDRKSIKRDGAARQLHSAEGSSAAQRGSLHYSPDTVLKMERNPSSLCHNRRY